MPERRYNDQEIAAIFRGATEGPLNSERDLPTGSGLTIAELQAIGREVGLSEESVAQAAHALDVQPAVTSRAFLGLPLAVSSTVDLNRWLTDDDWGRLVSQLREVFGARGNVRTDGSLRQWTNGNLHVLLEPTETGHRLRFGTLHGGARALISAGLIAMAISGIMLIVAAASGTVREAMLGILTTTIGGMAIFASGLVRLPGWARRRARQMEALATSLSSPPSAIPPPSDPL